MNYIEAILSGVLLGLIIALSVGPTLFAILKYCLQYGYKAGLTFVVGVSISDLIYVLLANLATEWMSFLNAYQREIGVTGALVFMGVGMFSFLKKTVPKRSLLKKEEFIPGKVFFRIWLSGFIMNALNPGVILTWMFSIAKMTAYTTSEKILFYSACLLMVLSIDLMKVFYANKIRLWLSLRKILMVNKISAVLIFIFGVAILVNSFLRSGF